MTIPLLTVALVRDVFHQSDAEDRLRARLTLAKEMGAHLALLPELPLNPWSPATKTPRDDDAEAPEGPRHQLQAKLAREIGIGLVGGVIVRDPSTGVRRNTALVFSPRGELLATYAKVHVPEEPGFWETSHYDPSPLPPRVIHGFDLPIGVQICSDINRPAGSHLLGYQGAKVILAPRSTEKITYTKWRPVFQANAITTASYVLSVNRPGPEQDVLIGGPSIAVAPDGHVMLETEDPVAVVTCEQSAIEQARIDYPGYLPVRADLYAQAWSELAEASRRGALAGNPAAPTALSESRT